VRCPDCGAEHELLDPVFARPDVVVAMAPDERRARVRESNDICAVSARGDAPNRGFVRCTLAVELTDGDGPLHWGLWAEVGLDDFDRILRAWDDPSQGEAAPFAARIANDVPGYDDTIGLAVALQLVDPRTRPRLAFAPGATHPFAVECRAGVTVHRALEWLAAIGGS
jgi:hypothetical protein